MLILPPADETVRIMSFDPGTDTLGLAVSDANFATGQVSVIHAETFKASKYVNLHDEYQLTQETYGDRQARLQSHHDRVLMHMEHWLPHIVVSESPFMGMRAQAFEALVECVNTLRWATYHFNPTVPLEVISPMSAKKVVGASGRGKDKHDVKDCIVSLMNQHYLTYQGMVPFDNLDEHSIDAITVGYAMVHFLKSEIG